MSQLNRKIMRIICKSDLTFLLKGSLVLNFVNSDQGFVTSYEGNPTTDTKLDKYFLSKLNTFYYSM